MNLDKTLIVVLSLLSVVVVNTIFNVNHTRNAKYEGKYTNNNTLNEDAFMNNIRYVPEIIRSFSFEPAQKYNKHRIDVPEWKKNYYTLENVTKKM